MFEAIKRRWKAFQFGQQAERSYLHQGESVGLNLRTALKGNPEPPVLELVVNGKVVFEESNRIKFLMERRKYMNRGHSVEVRTKGL